MLFLALAALVARRNGVEDVVVIAENGQMAIHLPLTTARIGAFSTHTAHPEFVHMMSKLLTTFLDYPIKIENPFLYMTKAEVVAATVKRHREVVEGTVSCWKTSRVVGDKKHCGYCVPCLSRRIALETHGLELAQCSGPCHLPQGSGYSFDTPTRARSASERAYFLTCERLEWPISSASSINCPGFSCRYQVPNVRLRSWGFTSAFLMRLSLTHP